MNMAINIKSFRRTAAVSLVVAAVVAGAAYAILQSRGELTGNTISTANEHLLISVDGREYMDSLPGFSFDNLIPGGWPEPVSGYPVMLRNFGSTPLDLRLALDGAPSNPNNADLNQFSFALMDNGEGTPRLFTLGSLSGDGQSLNDQIGPGESRQYTLQVQAADGAPQGISISDVNLSFVGTPPDPNQ
jgi:hypothetical protein